MFVDLPGEKWRSVVGYEGRYDVSNAGRVRTWLEQHGLAWALAAEPRIKKDQDHRCGYRQVHLFNGSGRSRVFYVHRLVAEAFLGPPAPGWEIRHLNGNKKNNHVENLAWGSPADNAADRMRHGHVRLGEYHHAHKLNPDAVSQMRRLRSLGETWASIAKKFFVTPRAVSMACTGITWRHVESSDEVQDV